MKSLPSSEVLVKSGDITFVLKFLQIKDKLRTLKNIKYMKTTSKLRPNKETSSKLWANFINTMNKIYTNYEQTSLKLSANVIQTKQATSELWENLFKTTKMYIGYNQCTSKLHIDIKYKKLILTTFQEWKNYVLSVCEIIFCIIVPIEAWFFMSVLFLKLT